MITAKLLWVGIYIQKKVGLVQAFKGLELTVMLFMNVCITSEVTKILFAG